MTILIKRTNEERVKLYFYLKSCGINSHKSAVMRDWRSSCIKKELEVMNISVHDFDNSFTNVGFSRH